MPRKLKLMMVTALAALTFTAGAVVLETTSVRPAPAAEASCQTKYLPASWVASCIRNEMQQRAALYAMYNNVTIYYYQQLKAFPSSFLANGYISCWPWLSSFYNGSYRWSWSCTW